MLSVMRNKIVALLICILATCSLTATAHGQNVWEKPYHQWSKKEAQQILTDSPWAQSLDYKVPSANGLKSESMGAAVIRLRSALPIRQAFVRLNQIKLKYDKMNAADKAKFDAEVKEFLECPPCAKYYVLTLEPFFTRDLKAYETGLKDKPTSYIYLANDKDERRDLVHAMKENQEMLFFFPRLDSQGKPLLNRDTKEFHFLVDKKLFEGKLPPLLPRKFTFEVSKLIQNSEIIF